MYNNITAFIRTHFSLGKSTLSPKKAVEIAAKRGYKSVAICDENTVSGMTDFISACKEHELNYIIGTSITVVNDPLLREKKAPNAQYQVKLFAKNSDGMKALFRLLTLANSAEYFYYHSRIGFEDILEELKHDNLVLLTGDLESIFELPKDDHLDKLKQLITVAGHNNILVELPQVSQPFFSHHNIKASKAAVALELQTMPTRPILYKQGDDKVRDTLAYICGNSKATHPLRTEPFTRDFCLEDVAKYKERILNANGALTESVLLDKFNDFTSMFSYRWEKQGMSLPKLAEDEFTALVKECRIGWEKRFSGEVFGHKPTEEELNEYKVRLKYELGVLREMKFAPYFLLVAYVCQWSKASDILLGPARGSAAGSLVAYLLFITEVDPIRFGLIFERFINPERLDYPDIDLDFMSSRREDVIKHCIDKFGKDFVAGISNYGMLGSSSALRDVARVNDLPSADYNCSKFVPKEHGSPVTLEEAVVQVPEIETYALKYSKLFEASCSLQGCMRNLGQHAAGLVISGEPLVNRAVVETRKGATLNWDKRIVEDWGLIKLDILGLSTLDIMRIAVDKIKARHKKTIDLSKIKLDDPKVLTKFGEGNTKGVFQFEGGTARHLLREIAVGGETTFDDIVAVNALNRPGPLDAGLAEQYCKIRQGVFAPVYPHPLTKSALEPTFGVMVYQEQIMQISRDLSGFTMAQADHLRKAIGKKDPIKMAEMEEAFISGATNNGMIEHDAIQLWNDILGFAAYSFNKSHAVAYSLISYQAMWLKAYYSAEFYAATMSVLDDDKVKSIAADAVKDGIHILPPDINVSTDKFEIGHDFKRCKTVLYTPLSHIKQVSSKAVNSIVEARNRTAELDIVGKPLKDEDGNVVYRQVETPFSSIADLQARVLKRVVNKRVVENLDLCGAFANIEEGQLASDHPERLRDQKALMGALALQDVKADRTIDMSPFVKAEIAKHYAELDEAHDGVVRPNFGKKPKFMVVTDCPTYFEEKEGLSMKGKSSDYLKRSLKKAGLKVSDGYYTSLCKVKKEGKQLSNAEINNFSPTLEREIELLNPPVIIALGGGAIRHFYPDVKGGIGDLTGRVEYDKERDCNVAFGINPQMIYPRPEMQETLDELIANVADMVI